MHANYSILEAEAISLLWGLQKVFNSNTFTSFNTLVESDNKVLIDMINEEIQSTRSVTFIVEDVLLLIQDEVAKTGRRVPGFAHVPRDSNRVALDLATGFDHLNYVIWEYDFPEFVMNLYLKDIAPLE